MAAPTPSRARVARLRHAAAPLPLSAVCHLQVAVEGQYYTNFKILLRLFDFKLIGRLRVSASHDLSTVHLSFLKPPRFRFSSECHASASSWVSVPLPLQVISPACPCVTARHVRCRVRFARGLRGSSAGPSIHAGAPSVDADVHRDGRPRGAPPLVQLPTIFLFHHLPES